MFYNKKFIFEIIVLLNHIEFVFEREIKTDDCFTSYILQELNTKREKLLKDYTKK